MADLHRREIDHREMARERRQRERAYDLQRRERALVDFVDEDVVDAKAVVVDVEGGAAGDGAEDDLLQVCYITGVEYQLLIQRVFAKNRGGFVVCLYPLMSHPLLYPPSHSSHQQSHLLSDPLLHHPLHRSPLLPPLT